MCAFLPPVLVGSFKDSSRPLCTNLTSFQLRPGSFMRTHHHNLEHNKRPATGLTTPQMALGFGFLSPKGSQSEDVTKSNRRGKKPPMLPTPEAQCACASLKPYGKCCRRFHTSQQLPTQAEDLLRSRYSAYAYRLPSYIMKTTHVSAQELDRRAWKKEILDFCNDYRFLGGVDVEDVQMPAPFTTRILFRANLMEKSSPISFLELATFVCDDGIWYYKSGKLVDVEQ